MNMNQNIIKTEYKSSVPIKGICHKDFQNVAETFAINFDKYSEIGSSLCVIADGEVIADLFAGHTTDEKNVEWNKNTLAVAFSCTKAAVALCAHILIDKGLLNVEEKVTKYWPEYGKNGKEDTTVEMILNHSAGLPALKTKVEEGGFLDWDYVVNLLENEEPFWTPGDQTGYHMMTTGWLIGEIIKRITGKSLRKFFKDEISDPLNLEYWIGLPESEDHRVAKVTPFTSCLLYTSPSPRDRLLSRMPSSA